MTVADLVHVFIFVLLVGAIPGVTFTVLYAVFVRHLTLAGKHMLIFTAVVAGLILDQLAVLLLDGWARHSVHVWVLLGLFVLLDIALWHRLIIFFKEQVVFNVPTFWKRRPRIGRKPPRN